MPQGQLIFMFDDKSLNVSLNFSEVGDCLQFIMAYIKNVLPRHLKALPKNKTQ